MPKPKKNNGITKAPIAAANAAGLGELTPTIVMVMKVVVPVVVVALVPISVAEGLRLIVIEGVML